VLHPVAGQPLLAHVLETLDELDVGRVLVVIGHQRERVREQFDGSQVEWVEQVQQCGTGHAVMMAAPNLEGFEGTLLVVCGDTPLLRPGTLDALLAAHQSSGASVTVLSMRLPDPTGYGRVLRGEGGALLGIVEHRDATPEQLRIDEVNSGIYAFRYPDLVEGLARLTSHNAQGEYYLTDSVTLLLRAGREARVVCTDDYRELLGINTLEQLAEAERVFHELGGRAAGGDG
jgi:bifunctional UDP-N-acetylglucosamine pyrophosphorylase/glucosamine-1-phosphate N-acetyltransferase